MYIRGSTGYQYKLGAHILEQSTLEKDLGVTIQNDLGSSAHLASKSALQHPCPLRRTFGTLEVSIFSQLFNIYVRPHIEYAIQVWHPWLKKDLLELDKAQRRATKMVRGMHNLTYQTRLQTLGLFSMNYRRLRGDLILVFQIFKTPDHPCRDLLQINHNNHLRGHKIKLKILYSRLECRRHFFSLRVCQIWNSIPEQVVSSHSLDSFKKSLDQTLRHLHYTVLS